MGDPEGWGESCRVGEDRVSTTFRATSWAKVTRSLFTLQVFSPSCKVLGSY